jgi:hypothetical protein
LSPSYFKRVKGAEAKSLKTTDPDRLVESLENDQLGRDEVRKQIASPIPWFIVRSQYVVVG